MAREIASSSKAAQRFDGESDDDDGYNAGDHSNIPVTPPKGKFKDKSNLFKKEGEPMEFYFLNNDVSRRVVTKVEEDIEEHGGTVLERPPEEGYVLVDPRTEAGVDYMSRRSTPTRRVVSYTFIQESIARGRLVPYLDLTLFIKQDKPVLFHLHKSLKKDKSEALRDAILLRGGNPDAALHHAQVLIHGNSFDDKASIAQRHKGIIIFETYAWLEACITSKRFALGTKVGVIPKTQPNPPGRKPGAARTEFTPEDDQHLIGWMAMRFGEMTAGRSGNKPFQLMVQDPRFTEWSCRHTWQSWRERYSKRRPHFDPLIAAHLMRHPRKIKESTPESFVCPSEPEVSEPDTPPSQPVLKKRKAQSTGENSVQPSGSSAADASEARQVKKARKPRRVEDEEDVPIKTSASQREKFARSPPPLPRSPSLPPPDETFPEPERASSPPRNRATEDESQDSQSSTHLQILDPNTSLIIQGALDQQRAELAMLEGMQRRDEDEDEDYEDDPDVDVEGVTQAEPLLPGAPIGLQADQDEDHEKLEETPNETGGTEIESVSIQLAQIADEFSTEITRVKNLYKMAAADREERDALDWVRQKVRESSKSKKGKGRAF